MNDDIRDIFDDADILDTDAIVYEMVNGESGGGMGLDYAQTDTPAGRISTLSELFLEWYLFDSSEEKDVKKFLAEAKIQDVLNEAQFMDLMCGMAYLDDDLLQLISLKLPFTICADKLHSMNAQVAKSKKAYKIESKSNVTDKIQEVALSKEEEQRAKKLRWYHAHRDHYIEYYQANKDWILAKNREWAATHPEQVRGYRKKYQKTHKKQIKSKSQALDEDKEAAQKICAAYVFLFILRAKNPSKYAELYTTRQEPLRHMRKKCKALQHMDINMCPFCNPECDQTVDTCCNQTVLSLPNAADELRGLADKLKRGKQPLKHIKTTKQKHKTKRVYRRKYDRLNKEQRKAQNQQWIQDHPERYQEYQTQWRTDNAEHLRQYQQQYREDNADDVSERKKKCYYAKHDKYMEHNRQNYQKTKAKKEAAKKICAAYVFLLNLKKTNKAKYSELYPGQRNPLVGMLKMCPALQSMDINLCPFCNPDSEQTVETCCNPNVLSLPDAISELQIISANLMKNRAQNGK
ncbi:MAG: hypothetical protein IKS08_03240 [Alphaproteobacteria bacterium]|nr:hypothetical protein [Alphaproteobacteria bacterium]